MLSRRVFTVLIATFLMLSFTVYAKDDGDQNVLIGFHSQIDELAILELKGNIKRKFSHIPVVSAVISPKMIQHLSGNPAIEYIESDSIVRATSQSVPWGITHVQATDVQSMGWTGKGVKVAVLDTGIDYSHLDLRVTSGVSFVAETIDYKDDVGHGTHVAGILSAHNNELGTLGVAPDVNLYAVKVLDRSSTGYISDIISGIEWSINNKMNVVNMSFEGDIYSKSLQRVLDKAYNSGILLFAAAGNQNNTITYPAAYPSVIAVGSVDQNNIRASSSGTGSKLELMAPGVGILSTLLNQDIGMMSGTSMASPHAAGVAALVLEAKPSLSAVEVRLLLQQTAVPLGNSDLYGRGLVNAKNAVIAN